MRFYFLCQLCGTEIKTDDVGAAREWLDNHVNDFKPHIIVLTDKSSPGQPITVKIETETVN